MRMPDDVPSCCCGDWIASLAHSHAARLAGIARHEGVSAADSLDVVQDALCTLLARPDADALRDRPADAARVLSAIVRNAARNARRRHHRARPHDAVEAAELVAPGPPADEAIDRAQTVAQLAGCMAQLGDIHRHIVTLRVLEEVSGDDAAAALGLTANHVAVLLHRARKELARCMLST